jgi:hypothetical protein
MILICLAQPDPMHHVNGEIQSVLPVARLQLLNSRVRRGDYSILDDELIMASLEPKEHLFDLIVRKTHTCTSRLFV